MAPIPSQSPEPIYADRSPSTPAPFFASPLVNLIMRVFAFLFLLASMITITTNSHTEVGYYTVSKARFHYMNAYRYMLFTIVIGFVYMLLQIAFNIYHVMMGLRISPVLGIFDFYADKVISYILATGTAATFGATVEFNALDDFSYLHKFWNQANAAASLLLFAFVFSAVSSVFSSLALRKQY